MKKFMKREWKEREIEKILGPTTAERNKAQIECGYLKKEWTELTNKNLNLEFKITKLENEVKRHKNEKDDYKELYEILSQKYKKINLENKKHRFHSKFIRNYVLVATIVIAVLSFIEGYLIINA